MTANFQSLSNGIASDFIQSVVFIDDKAYLNVDEADNKHDFDARSVIKSFAKNKTICSVFQPEVESDIQLFSDVAIKADVTVLDWQIIVNRQDTPSSDGDEDDDNDNVKGIHTLNIIYNLLNSVSRQNSLKLIIVYTGEPDLEDIAKDILSNLKLKQIDQFNICNDDSCCIKSASCKILIRAKSNGGEDRGKHIPKLKNKQVLYQDLPEFINNEFAKMTNGLLPNFTLQALTAIRNNTFQILNIFSRELDSAYLTHKSLLPNTSNANELLVELLGDTLTSILRAKNLNNTIDLNIIGKWIEEFIEEDQRPILDNNGNKTTKTFLRKKELLKTLLISKTDIKEKFISVLTQLQISKTSADKNYKKYAFSLFHQGDNDENINKKFAMLCQHKDLIKYDDHTPSLTLGTVVKSTLGHATYYVCIQQRCDSVRITGNDNYRRFLFLSLSKIEGATKFDFLTPDGIKLKLDQNTFDIRTIKFSGSDSGLVKSVPLENEIHFIPLHYADDANVESEKFKYVFELKDLYSQRIVAEYSSKLSRVGLDEPEWVRLS